MSDIMQHLEAIRERQRKATQGRWKLIDSDGRKNIGIELVSQIVPEWNPTKPLVTFSATAWRPEHWKSAKPNAEYIAAACSPEGGDVTRLLAAVEVMTSQLEALSHLGNGSRPGNSIGNAMAQETLSQAAAHPAGEP